MISEFHEGLDAFARTYLSRTAARLEATVPCVPCGADDYTQELQWNLLRRQPRFDPSRGRWATFVRLVTDHRAVELRQRCLRGQCKSRMFRPMVDLTSDWDIEDPEVARNETLSAMKSDVHAWLASLAPDDQEFCRALMRSSVSEAARELQIPRSTAYEAIGRLRKRFERTSLIDYVTAPKSPRRDAPRDG